MATPTTRRPTREEALKAAAKVYLQAKLRIETEKAIAAAMASHEEAPDAGKSGEGDDQNIEGNQS